MRYGFGIHEVDYIHSKGTRLCVYGAVLLGPTFQDDGGITFCTQEIICLTKEKVASVSR